MNFNLSNHQYYIAISLCQMQLGLLSRDETIKFTHNLMNIGFYDDLMLDVIDDDLTKVELHNLVLKICQNLNFTLFNDEELKFIFTLYKINPFVIFPLNPKFLNDMYIWKYFHLCWFDEKEKLHYDLIDHIYQYNYDLEMMRDCYNNSPILFEFSLICQNWINQHHHNLTQILTPFSDIKIPNL